MSDSSIDLVLTLPSISVTAALFLSSAVSRVDRRGGTGTGGGVLRWAFSQESNPPRDVPTRPQGQFPTPTVKISPALCAAKLDSSPQFLQHVRLLSVCKGTPGLLSAHKGQVCQRTVITETRHQVLSARRGDINTNTRGEGKGQLNGSQGSQDGPVGDETWGGGGTAQQKLGGGAAQRKPVGLRKARFKRNEVWGNLPKPAGRKHPD
ncbi:hypothetical protein Bbelb_119850 [Branchiostoma belcheri]|nr:hypothetical protein Bbelb_119850 [Branchiostoma belcheri]